MQSPKGLGNKVDDKSEDAMIYPFQNAANNDAEL
jgi:hypothetical protein